MKEYPSLTQTDTEWLETSNQITYECNTLFSDKVCQMQLAVQYNMSTLLNPAKPYI